MKNISLLIILIIGFASCNYEPKSLPYMGEKKEVDGALVNYTVPPFTFVNQDSSVVSNNSLAGEPYVADFFFTSCPTICPKVKQQMLRLYNEFDQEPLSLLSMSIDYHRDSIPVLKKYSTQLNVSSDRWHFVQLKKDEMSSVANQYFNVAYEDESIPGGFDHSGRLILVDGTGHIRAACDGTDPDSVDDFMEDIKTLLDEES